MMLITIMITLITTQVKQPAEDDGAAKKKFKTQTFLVVKPKDGSKPKVYQEISDYDGYELPISASSSSTQQQQQQTSTPAAAAPPPPPPQRPTTQPPPLPAPRSPSSSDRKPNVATVAGQREFIFLHFTNTSTVLITKDS